MRKQFGKLQTLHGLRLRQVETAAQVLQLVILIHTAQKISERAYAILIGMETVKLQKQELSGSRKRIHLSIFHQRFRRLLRLLALTRPPVRTHPSMISDLSAGEQTEANRAEEVNGPNNSITVTANDNAEDKNFKPVCVGTFIVDYTLSARAPIPCHCSMHVFIRGSPIVATNHLGKSGDA